MEPQKPIRIYPRPVQPVNPTVRSPLPNTRRVELPEFDAHGTPRNEIPQVRVSPIPVSPDGSRSGGTRQLVKKSYRIVVEFPDWLSVLVLPVTISLTCVVLLTLYFGVKENSPQIFIDQQGNVYRLR